MTRARTAISLDEVKTNLSHRLNISLVKGAVMLVTGGLAAQGLSALTGLLVARWLGPGGYGYYAAAFVLANAFVFTFLLGLDSVVVREVAKQPSSAPMILASAGLPAVVWSGLLLALIGLVGRWLGYSARVMALQSFFAPAMAIKALLVLVRAWARGLQRFAWDAFLQFFEAAAILVLVVARLRVVPAPLEQPSAAAAAAGFLTGEMVTLVLAILFILPLSPSHFPFSSPLARQLVRQALPLGATFTLLGVAMRLDLLLLGRAAPAVQLGMYAAALGVAMLPRSLCLVSAALLPHLSAGFDQGVSVFWPFFKKGFWAIAFLGLFIGLVTFVFARPLLALLYGPAFIGAAPALKILALMTSFLFINTYLWQVFIAVGMPARMAAAVFASLLLAVLLAVSLIPQFGLLGAAMAALGREICQFLLMACFLYWTFADSDLGV